MDHEPLLRSLRIAVEAAPEDIALRLHLARMLDEAGYRAESLRHVAGVLQRDPLCEDARDLIRWTAERLPPRAAPEQHPPDLPADPPADPPAPRDPAEQGTLPIAPPTVNAPPLPRTPPTDHLLEQQPAADAGEPADEAEEVGTAPDAPVDDLLDDDEVLARLETELGELGPGLIDPGAEYGFWPADVAATTMADVGGLAEVKARLETSLFAPMRNPELSRRYGTNLRGGLLLYGPPGCGKTFLARAVAGELGASFIPVTLADVLDIYAGHSEYNVHSLFRIARASAPCVLFLDEVDAIGHRRSQLVGSGLRGTVNQLLTEMDGLAGLDDGVFVLGATNHPWDVDSALRRPGRFDRMMFVGPPDREARTAILGTHLHARPVADIDLGPVARATEGFSGADLALLCDAAAEHALVDSSVTGSDRLIDANDLLAAQAALRPSIGAWLETARNVAQFANSDGSYDELLAYLRTRGRRR